MIAPRLPHGVVTETTGPGALVSTFGLRGAAAEEVVTRK
jgi:hypothetical protein